MRKKNLNVLFITNMYPNQSNPNFGLFVKEQIEQLSMAIETYRLINIAKRNHWFFKYGLSLLDVIRCISSRRFNIIHVHFGLTAVVVIPFILLIKLLGIRTVITFHGTDVVGKNPVGVAISKLAARIFDLSICVSDDIHKIISNYSKHAAKISCGISSEFFNHRANLDRQPVIIFPSDPQRKEKNFKLFKMIFDRLKQRYPDVSFACIKNLTKKDVIELMTQSKCLLMTSYYEGSHQTVKEAIVCNLPVVSTPVGDVPYLLANLPGCSIGRNPDELLTSVSTVLESFGEYQYPDEIKKNLSNIESCKKIIHSYHQIIH